MSNLSDFKVNGGERLKMALIAENCFGSGNDRGVQSN